MKTKRLLSGVALFAVVMLITMFVLNPLVRLAGSLIGRVLIYCIYAAVAWGAAKLIKLSNEEIGFSKDGEGAQVAWGLGLALALLLVFVGAPRLAGIAWENILPAKPGAAGMLMYSLMLRFIFVGPVEEYAFRGVIMPALQSGTGSKLAAALISSAMFGAWHYITSGNIAQVIVTGVIGLWFALARLYIPKCSLASCAIGHGLYDCGLVVLSWVVG